MQDFDVLIIGGGVAGASAGYFLAQAYADLRIGLIEAENQPGYHTSGRSAAILIPGYGGSSVAPFTRASRHFFDSSPDAFCDHPLISPRGSLHIARADQADGMAQCRAELDAQGAEYENIDPARIGEFCPLIRPGYAVDALYDANCFDLDVSAIHQGFLRGLTASGGEIITKTCLIAAKHNGNHWKVVTTGGSMSAGILLNAAGAWGDEVAQMAGVEPLGLKPLRRTIIVTPSVEKLDRDMPVVVDAVEDFYFRVEGDGVLASPGDATPSPPCDAQPEEEDVATIAWRLQQATTLPVKTISNKWAGLRTFSPDDVPAIGFAPDADGFFWCVGQGGFGIQTAPAIGAMSAALITGGDLPSWVKDAGAVPETLDPARFSIPLRH